MSEIQALAATLLSLAKPEMKPKELIAAVRKHHSDASKKEIVRAAFFALTQDAEGNAARAEHLHAFALSERAGDDEEASSPKKLRKKGRRKAAEVHHSTH